MDGKDKIIEKILSDAENYRSKIISDADADYEKMTNEARKQADDFLAKEESLLKAEESEALKRKKVVAALDGKKLYLSKKTEAVDNVFTAALDRLNNLERSAYKSVICRFIENNANDGDTVLLPKNTPFTVNEVLAFSVVKDKNLKVKDGGKFSGGVIIEGKLSDVNLSFEAVIATLKEKYETYVAEKLFD